ncbi:MAG TPA: site-2 protease family protein [Pyrinomonadaceae bacterium]|nr:site-2 protease family protein [Pyrinomonadaceae bacterium]
MLISYLICFAIAMLIHELGHLAAARVCRVPATELGLGWGRRLCGFRLGQVEYKLHLLPIGAYVRLDMEALERRPLSQQSFILLAGIIVNLLAAVLTGGTSFSLMNLLLAATNLLPLYQQDGWKCGMVLLRAVMRRKSALVEWTFTIAGSFLSLALLIAQALRYRSF